MIEINKIHFWFRYYKKSKVSSLIKLTEKKLYNL